MKPTLNGISYVVFAPWCEVGLTGEVTDDGDHVVGTTWKINGENLDGHRCMSHAVYETEYKAIFDALRMNRENNDGVLDMDQFYYVEPAYGSKAYVELDIERIRYEQERRADKED